MFSKSLVISGVLAVVLFRAKIVSAQGTNVTCLPQYGWMDNSRGQNPCLITAYLNSACLADPTDAYVYSLPDDYHYTSPAVQFATPCQCSTVFYSTIGACATCQNRESLPWLTWQTNCSTDYIGVWPGNIPSGTSIPAWAYLDVTRTDAFNASAAQANAAQDPPESSAIPSATPSIGFSSPLPTATGSGAATPLAPSSAPTLPASSPGKKSNTGAIVGGVVGGVGGVAIIAGIIAYFIMKSRQSTSANTYAANGTTAASASTFGPHDDMGTSHIEKTAFDATTYAAPAPLTTPPPSTSMSVYNPNDPSTFPSSPAPMSMSGTTVYNPSLNQGYMPSNQTGRYSSYSGGYTGVAEV